MPDLTPETLAELRQLAEAATPGPWIACEDEDEVLIVLDDDSNHWPGRYTAIARGFEQGDDYGLSDAMLVTAAVNALPALLDAVAERDALAALNAAAERDALVAAIERQKEGREYLRAERDALRNWSHDLQVELKGAEAQRQMLLAERDALAADVLALLDAAAERDALAAAVERVRSLHHEGAPFVRPGGQDRRCSCGGRWPCPTIRALDESPRCEPPQDRVGFEKTTRG